MMLSALYAWQEVLDAPIAELLVESEEPLSAPVLRRAQMVRLMKTAGAILERAQQPSIRRMAQMLVDQLCEVMPELKGVSPWHAVGRRRTQDELGQAAYRRIPTDVFRRAGRFEPNTAGFGSQGPCRVALSMPPWRVRPGSAGALASRRSFSGLASGPPN